MRWLPFLAIREQLLGVSGPYIMGARSNVPPIIDWPRKAARGSTIFPYRSNRVEKQVFPRQCRSRRTLPASPWSKGLEQILTYKENMVIILSCIEKTSVLLLQFLTIETPF